MTKLRLITINTLVMLAVVAAVAGPARAGISGANGIDADNNGYYDAYIREPPFFATGNVGATCSYYYDSNHVFTGKITVRPPRVWAINGLSNQQVAWRIAAFNNANPQKIAYASAWVYSSAGSDQSTEFGGGGDGYPFYVTSSSYWAGSQSLVRSNPTADGWQPAMQVAWLNAATNTWTVRYLLVHYALVNGSAIPNPVC